MHKNFVAKNPDIKVGYHTYRAVLKEMNIRFTKLAKKGSENDQSKGGKNSDDQPWTLSQNILNEHCNMCEQQNQYQVNGNTCPSHYKTPDTSASQYKPPDSSASHFKTTDTSQYKPPDSSATHFKAAGASTSHYKTTDAAAARYNPTDPSQFGRPDISPYDSDVTWPKGALDIPGTSAPPPKPPTRKQVQARNPAEPILFEETVPLTKKILTNMEKHRMKPPCRSNCPRRCTVHFDHECRHSIWKTFWLMKYNERKEWIFHHVNNTPKKTGGQESRRGSTRIYNLVDDVGRSHTVCKIFFLSTLSISDSMITTLFRPLAYGARTLVKDKRGGKRKIEKKEG